MEGLIVLWMYGFLPVGSFSCFVKNWTPSKRLTTCTTWVRLQFTLITLWTVRSEYKSKALHIYHIHAVFLQFDFSEGQKLHIPYCIHYICKFSLQYWFSDNLQSHSLWLQALSYKFHLCGFVAETSTQETKHHIQRVGELKFIMSAGPEVVTP